MNQDQQFHLMTAITALDGVADLGTTSDPVQMTKGSKTVTVAASKVSERKAAGYKVK